MLSFAGFAMVAAFMTLIMTRRLSAMIALILVPLAFALALGFAPGVGAMMLSGVNALAPTSVMLIFAILYFGLMIDAGLFDPLVKTIAAMVEGDPVRILVGTAVLTMIVSLDGDGATTYMIVTAAMVPLYRHMRMDPARLACVAIMASAVLNLLPWGGPTARVVSALHLEVSAVFIPLLPAMAAAAAWVIFAAWRMGRAERARLAKLPPDAIDEHASGAAIIAENPDAHLGARRPALFWFNLALTLALLAALISGLTPLPVLFMVAFAIAAAVNYPHLEDQRARIGANAANALMVGGMVFAAGIFTGILSGTGMVGAMSKTMTAIVPADLGAAFAPVTALLSAPLTYLISNDAFYFGVLPILAETASHYGVPAAEIGRAALVGQQVHLLSPLVPSTYLLVGLCGVDFGDLTRTAFPWALGACAVFFLACIATGAFGWA